MPCKALSGLLVARWPIYCVRGPSMDLREDLRDLLPSLLLFAAIFFLDMPLYAAVKMFDLQIIASSTLYLQKLHFVLTSSLSIITNLYLVCCIFGASFAKFACMLHLLLPICFHGNFDLLAADEWVCNWYSATKSVDVESAFAMWVMQMFLKYL